MQWGISQHSTGEIATELGTFVGYTAVRIAWRLAEGTMKYNVAAGPRLCCIEVDPVHVVIAQHHLDHARLSADLWVGQAADLEPRLAEERGTRGTGFVFMDHRGTRFHEDAVRLASLCVVAIAGSGLGCHDECESRGRAITAAVTLALPPRLVADNVLKPGAPRCTWLAARLQGGVSGNTTAALFWSLPEFMQAISEDWMLAGCF